MGAKSHDFIPVARFYSQLLLDGCPVCKGYHPLPDDTPVGQIDKFQIDKFLQSCIRGKHTFVFLNFAYLTMIAFYGIGGVDEPAHFFGVLEEIIVR